jgi:putative thiamine transport system permease protein
MRHLGVVPLTALLVAPLVLSVALVAPTLLDGRAFAELTRHPQFWGALGLTMLTGVVSTCVALVLALLVVARRSAGLASRAGVFLAIPHLSFAIGLGFLIMPAGMLARLIAVFAGWALPPQWVTTQDPYGLSLTVALALKETPFLVWALTSLLNRDDVRERFVQQRSVAASLGHSEGSTFLRVILPQLLSRIVWPLVAVLAYGLTVVDMALVIGPTQPPTLAQLVWTDLNDADIATNARGGAGVLALSAIIIGIVVCVACIQGVVMPWIRIWWSWHPGRGALSTMAKPSRQEVPLIWAVMLVIYAAVILVLILQSFAGLWAYPKLLPEQFTLSAWSRLLENVEPIVMSLWLALATASLSLMASVMWLETQSPERDRWLLLVAAFVLCLPSLVIGLGQYRLFLQLGISGTMLAMFFAHVLPVAAYLFIMLQGPYRGFDQRYAAAAQGLGVSTPRFLVNVKWPMLKAALFSSFAVGFAVSMAQYVPAQLAAAGRFSTLSMEAVTLTSGGNRALTAAYGLALMALPLIVFLGAARLGRPRWSHR